MNIHQTAQFQVKADPLSECEAAIPEFVAAVQANSEAVKRFTDILYPRLVAPVDLTEFFLFASTRTTG